MGLHRFIASSPPGIVVTAGLLLLMQQLIHSGGQALGDAGDLPPAFILSTVSLPPITPQRREEIPPRRIVSPAQPPGTRTVSVPKDEKTMPPGLPGRELPLPPVTTNAVSPAWSDSPLVSIVRVEPDYPPRAAADRREGYVLVQFDVEIDGSVSNEQVVESSDVVFERAALQAASRFRYRARVVDGQPQETANVRTMFRFTMDGER